MTVNRNSTLWEILKAWWRGELPPPPPPTVLTVVESPATLALQEWIGNDFPKDNPALKPCSTCHGDCGQCGGTQGSHLTVDDKGWYVRADYFWSEGHGAWLLRGERTGQRCPGFAAA